MWETFSLAKYITVTVGGDFMYRYDRSQKGSVV